MKRLLAFLTRLFPLWVSLAAAAALIRPELLTWFSGPLITWGLGIIMLGMGLTLTPQDFSRVFLFPGWVLTGIALQYTVMPALGWSLGYLFDLPSALAAGLVLVSCCPGGTASNVVTFLARGNVALSVTMTALSTLLAVIMTPFLTSWLAGSRVPVDTAGLLLSTLQVVILPVAAGIALHHFAPRVTERVLPFAPLVAILVIALIVGSIIGAGKDTILNSGLRLLSAVFCLHVLGFLAGYAASRLLSKNRIVARTTSIEVGMQNSGLGVVLARAHFVNPAVAIPSAVSSLMHCLIGSFAAAVWRLRPPADDAGSKSRFDFV